MYVYVHVRMFVYVNDGKGKMEISSEEAKKRRKKNDIRAFVSFVGCFSSPPSLPLRDRRRRKEERIQEV